MVRVEERFMIQELFRNGVSISEIARRTGRDRKTVRSVINGPFMPAVKARPPRVRKIDPFVAYLEKRIERACSTPRSCTRRFGLEGTRAKSAWCASSSSRAVLQNNRWRRCVSRRSRATSAGRLGQLRDNRPLRTTASFVCVRDDPGLVAGDVHRVHGGDG